MKRTFLVFLVSFWVCTIMIMGAPITAHSGGPVCYGPPIYSSPPIYVKPLYVPPPPPVFVSPRPLFYQAMPSWCGLGVRIDLGWFGSYGLHWGSPWWY